jgi:molybdenum cofactor cytidylyltransferase
VDAVVLAAGLGRRMGGAKHLLPLDEKPLLAHVLEAVGGSRVRKTRVVLRVGDVAGQSLSLELGAEAIWAETTGEGRAASVRAGVRATPADAAGLLFAMADQPFLGSEDFDALIAAFREGRSGIVHASYDGARGTPVLFSAHYRDELLSLRDRQGGRVLMARHPTDVRGVALDPARGRDLDRPEDLPSGDTGG